MSFFTPFTLARMTSFLFAFAMMAFQTVAAQGPIYTGGGPLEGLNAAAGLTVPQDADPRVVITSILSSILSFMALVSVAAIIIAGIYLIVGLGSDESKDKAKKIIQYTLIGLVIILFSRVIVSLVTVYLASQVST